MKKKIFLWWTEFLIFNLILCFSEKIKWDKMTSTVFWRHEACWGRFKKKKRVNLSLTSWGNIYEVHLSVNLQLKWLNRTCWVQPGKSQQLINKKVMILMSAIVRFAFGLTLRSNILTDGNERFLCGQWHSSLLWKVSPNFLPVDALDYVLLYLWPKI